MEVDEGSNKTTNKGHFANVQSVNDDEFFEFEKVESHYNKNVTETNESHTETEIPNCRFCWSAVTDEGNPLISSC